MDRYGVTLKYDYDESTEQNPREGKEVPKASRIADIVVESPDDFVNYIACDTIEYQRKNNNKAIKKTLSIPEWLNELAVAKGINFSQVLQDALKAELGING